MIDWHTLAPWIEKEERFLFLLQWADHREEQGLAGAAGLRWLARKERWPAHSYVPGFYEWYRQYTDVPPVDVWWLPSRCVLGLISNTTKSKDLAGLILMAAIALEEGGVANDGP